MIAFVFSVLLCCGSAQEEPPLKIEIVPLVDEAGKLYLPHGSPFEVRFSNTSERPLKLWEEHCRPEHDSLTFLVKDATAVTRKRALEGNPWEHFPLRTFTIPPKQTVSRKVDFNGFFWGHLAWANAPEPNTGARIDLQAVLGIQADQDARDQGVWTGRIESPSVKVLLINPKLKTPHDYLWNDCPRQALRVLESDPTWVRKTDDLQCTPLHHAARFGPRDVVVWLIEHGAGINATCYNQFTPLYFAASYGHLDIVKVLVEKGANIEAASNGGTPLQAAAQQNQRDVVKFLLDSKAAYDLDSAITLADIEQVRTILKKNPEEARGENVLHTACSGGTLEIVALLIANGADPNDTRRHWQYPPLLSGLRHAPIVKLLLDKGADPKVRLNIKGLAFGSTLLHEAARRGDLESARLLIDHGADIEAPLVEEFANQPAKVTVFTPLHSAASGGQPKLVDLLLDRKADPKRKTSGGQTALELAGTQIRFAENEKTREENRRYAAVVRILASRGLEIGLFTAIAMGDAEQVAARIKTRPDCVNDKDPRGDFPLHRAIAMDERTIIATLLEAGAGVNVKGANGFTPLHTAAFWGRPETARLLLDRKADVDATCEYKATPLAEARRVAEHSKDPRYDEVIRLLLERGAK